MKIIISEKMQEKLLEELSELEHKQWMHWVKEILKEEEISEEREERWKEDFKSYKDLPDSTKEFDREYAEKIIKKLREKGLLK